MTASVCGTTPNPINSYTTSLDSTRLAGLITGLLYVPMIRTPPHRDCDGAAPMVVEEHP